MVVKVGLILKIRQEDNDPVFLKRMAFFTAVDEMVLIFQLMEASIGQPLLMGHFTHLMLAKNHSLQQQLQAEFSCSTYSNSANQIYIGFVNFGIQNYRELDEKRYKHWSGAWR